MNRTNISLPDELRDRLDERAAQAGVSRAELIRQLLERGLAEYSGDADAYVLPALAHAPIDKLVCQYQDRGHERRHRPSRP